MEWKSGQVIVCRMNSIHLSFTFGGKHGVAKPDIVIFRKSEPLVVMEFKIAPYTKSSGEKDIERLKYWASDFSKGYFVHIDKSERKYSQRITNWKNHYYKELAYYTHNEKGCLFEVKHGKNISEI